MSSIPSLSYSSRSTSASDMHILEETREWHPSAQLPSQVAVQPTSVMSMHSRKVSEERNASLREALKAWGLFPKPPPQGRTIESSWSGSMANRASRKSKEELAMSELWTAKAIVPEFNPPLLERTYLGIDEQESKQEPEPEPESELRSQPKPIANAQFKLRPSHQNKRAHNVNQSELPVSSWCTVSSESQSEVEVETIMVFKRAPVKPANTTSLLTKSRQPTLQDGPEENTNPAGFFARVMGNQVLSVEMLPSAFDTDSEDEGDDG